MDEALLKGILEFSGRRSHESSWQAVSGGNINQAFRIELADGEKLFLKLNKAEHGDMFRSEVECLTALGETHAIRVPWPIGQGIHEDHAWLLCEYLPLGPGDPHAEERLGEGLAALHAHHADAFGWTLDNHIGLSLQRNDWTKDWPEFFARQRLGYQRQLLSSHDDGRHARLVEHLIKLEDALPDLLSDDQPKPSLLHGDLWFGNWGALSNGEPVVFDPACHYGDPDCDLAMTELFGGFGKRFYQAYRHHMPEQAGYPFRRDLYQLYHAINHLNLFGDSYLPQVNGLLHRIQAHSK